MAEQYTKFPPGCTLKVEKFTAQVPERQLQEFKTLLALSKVGPKTHENTREDRQYGIVHNWFTYAKAHWENNYDWRKCEARINSFPNYMTQVEHEHGDTKRTHFIALFSNKPDAIPIALLHGWPGSILEFLSICELLRDKYTPDTLPYHVIVPSLPGYAYSEGPPVSGREWSNEDMALVMHNLMIGLGFKTGYVAQGGDIGSFLCRIMAKKYDACKAILLNYNLMASEPEGAEPIEKEEEAGVKRMQDWMVLGKAYAEEHGTKPGTVGLVLASSPLATLAWIGEKYQAWTDEDPPIDFILDSVTLYWFTESFPRAIYPYIQYFGKGAENTVFHPDPNYTLFEKPVGYSYFPWELAPIPVSWAKKTANIVWFRRHKSGGHFAAVEKPKELLEDLEEFIAQEKATITKGF